MGDDREGTNHDLITKDIVLLYVVRFELIMNKEVRKVRRTYISVGK